MYNVNLTLTAYELTNECVTGFKVFKDGEQVATIEQRNNEWIGAIMLGFKVMMFTHEKFDFVLNKITKTVVVLNTIAITPINTLEKYILTIEV